MVTHNLQAFLTATMYFNGFLNRFPPNKSDLANDDNYNLVWNNWPCFKTIK